MVQSTPSRFRTVDKPGRENVGVVAGDERYMASYLSLSPTSRGGTTPETRCKARIGTYEYKSSGIISCFAAETRSVTACADFAGRELNRFGVKQGCRAEAHTRTTIDHTSDCAGILDLETGFEAGGIASD